MGYYDDYLEHHGILGQKWGVRRFENKNGHLTAAGKKRYDGDKVSKKEQREAYNKAYDKWSAGQDKNDAEYRKVQELRKGLGKTGITRTINAARNKSDAAKEYNKAYDKWSKQQDKLDKEWEDVKASKPGLTDKQKKALVIGAAAVGTAVVAYGGYKLYQLNKNATEGMASRDKQKSAQKFTDSFDQEKMANKVEAIASGYLSGNSSDKVANANYKSTMESANTIRSYAKEDLEEARSLANKAANKDYSVKEKADYIRNQYKAEKAPSSANDQKSSLQWQAAQQTTKKVISSAGQQKFNQASKVNDDFVNELLKKNAAMLAGF